MNFTLHGLQLEHDKTLDKRGDGAVRTAFQSDVCQCCGFKEEPRNPATCVCDQLDWYMLPGGGVECQAHRFMRAMKGPKRRFFFFKER